MNFQALNSFWVSSNLAFVMTNSWRNLCISIFTAGSRRVDLSAAADGAWVAFISVIWFYIQFTIILIFVLLIINNKTLKICWKLLTTYSCSSCSFEASLLTKIFSLCDASAYCCLYFSSDSLNEATSPEITQYYNYFPSCNKMKVFYCMI